MRLRAATLLLEFKALSFLFFSLFVSSLFLCLSVFLFLSFYSFLSLSPLSLLSLSKRQNMMMHVLLLFLTLPFSSPLNLKLTIQTRLELNYWQWTHPARCLASVWPRLEASASCHFSQFLSSPHGQNPHVSQGSSCLLLL